MPFQKYRKVRIATITIHLPILNFLDWAFSTTCFSLLIKSFNVIFQIHWLGVWDDVGTILKAFGEFDNEGTRVFD